MGPLPNAFRQSREKSACIKITITYIVVCSLSIVGSDFLLYAWFHHQIVAPEIFKGLLCVIITGGVIYAVLRKYLFDLWDSKARGQISEQQFRELFQNANDGIALIELQDDGKIKRVVEVNVLFCQLLSCSREQILEIPQIQPELSEEEWNEICTVVDQIVQQGSLRFEWLLESKDGGKIPVEVSARCFAYGGRRDIMCIFRDITERKRSEEFISCLAYHDQVTNLPNFNYLEDKCLTALAEAKKNGHMFALLEIDFDRWKMIHETMGRKFSHLLLRCIAIQLGRFKRQQDVLTRGDTHDFILLLWDISGAEEVIEMVRKMGDAFKAPLVVQGNEVRITPHIGIAIYPDNGKDLETLMRSIHMAVGCAKETGSLYHLYDRMMSQDSWNVMMMENDLRKALVAEQFELVYQPQIHIQTGEWMGMEALIRWRHPEQGEISPAQFIPLAEEIGLIVPIGEWVIRTACRQNKAWQEMGLSPVPVAVNLSVHQFLRSNIVDSVGRILHETGLSPQYLELEITESMTMDVNRAVTILYELKALGVRISMDDFGTGYSSLTHLKEFPLDKLKIDQSFIREAATNTRDASIVATIIAIAHNLDLTVIAEGVEKQEQIHFLQRQQCDGMQGFLFSPPLSVERLEAMLLVQPSPGIPIMFAGMSETEPYKKQ
ncbi:MAG TPA: EAL domain-containing protein [Bacilli bacterium]